MASSPRFKRFLKEDFRDAPTWFGRFLDTLNETINDLASALSNSLTRSKNMLSQVEDMAFTTAASAADTFPLKYKNKLGVKVQNAWVSMFSKKTGGTLSGAWSVTILANQNGEIEVTFQGLENSTDYVGKLILEG